MTAPAGPDVVDIWVNVLSAEDARRFTARTENAGIPDFFGEDPSAATGDGLLALMDRLGVRTAVLTGALSARQRIAELSALCAEHPDRFSLALVADRPEDPVRQCRELRAAAADPWLTLVRVTPLVHQYPLNDKLYYPVYATCAELELPVSINVGVPGPRVRSECQHPARLEDVLIDFPGLVVIGAHMGHPYEALLVQYMLKWPTLYLSTSAYLARYLDPGLLSFMGSSRGIGRVLYASDHPFLPMQRALDAARALPLTDEAMSAFLGGTARRLLSRKRG